MSEMETGDCGYMRLLSGVRASSDSGWSANTIPSGSLFIDKKGAMVWAGMNHWSNLDTGAEYGIETAGDFFLGISIKSEGGFFLECFPVTR